MTRNLFIFIFLVLFITGCKKSSEFNIPAPNDLVWGENSQKTVDKMIKNGWVIVSKNDQQVMLKIPIDIQHQDEIMNYIDENAEPYMATLFSQNGKLVIMKLFHKDSQNKSQSYLDALLKLHNFKQEIWQSFPRSYKSDTGNQIADNTAIYENDRTFAVMHKTQIQVSEKLKSSASDSGDLSQTEIEFRFLSKEFNEGLNKEALIKSVKSGLNP